MSLDTQEERRKTITSLITRYVAEINELRIIRNMIGIMGCPIALYCVGLSLNLLYMFVIMLFIRATLIIVMRHAQPRDYLAWYIVLGLVTIRPLEVTTVSSFIAQHEYELTEERNDGCYVRLLYKWRLATIETQALFPCS